MLYLQNRTIRCHIFMKIGDRVALGLEIRGSPRCAACRLRPEGQGVVDVIFIKTGFDELFRRQILGELVDDSADHFHMRQFFCTQRSSGNVPLSQSNEPSDFTGFLVYSLKTSDKVVRYGEKNQVKFSEHPTVVQRGNERTINLLVSTPDVA